MTIVTGLSLVVPAASATAAEPDPPRALPQNAPADELKWQPVLDYDTDGCYNVPAIGPDGTIAQGLPHSNVGLAADCRDQSDLDNTNTYSRSRCNSGWCVYLYAYYFEKDVATGNISASAGHRHDWEHIAVWVKDDQAQYVSTSAHGKYNPEPARNIRWEGTHPKIVYHKDAGSTHAFRFAAAGDEPPENHYHNWRQSALVGYDGFPAGLRDKLVNHAFGSATLAIKDSQFASNIKSSIPTLPDCTSRHFCDPDGWEPRFPFDANVDDRPPPPQDVPNEPPPNPYPSDARTFTVEAGGTSFSATQPRNSVATYTWTDGEHPEEWLTSASGSELNRTMTKMTVAAYGAATETISVDAGRTHQTIDGFGGAMTDSAAALILGSPNRDDAMNRLFGTGPGQAGLTMVRSPMGSSDLMADGNDFHTYEDVRGSFSVDAFASDRRQIEALQQAKRIVGSKDFKLIGTPWSAPGWAKRGGSLRARGCGIEANELDVRQAGAYADYFTKYVAAYDAKGIKPWMVSLQNEPQNCKTAMPTTLLSASDSVVLGKELQARLPGDVKVLGWDHNWNDKHYVDALTASGSVDAVGYHCYDGNHYANQTTAVATYMTECSGFTDSSANVEQNLGWEVANMLMGPLRHGSKGSIYWSLAQDQNGNPRLNGPDACGTCRGMLTKNAAGQIEPSQDFYYFAQFSAFVRPGSVRIESTNSGDVSTVAFRNGNTTTLVALVSSHHADGGKAGSDERDLRRHIVQFDGENVAQKTAWLVGADGYRRWISDGSTFNCLKYDAGMQGPDSLPGGALDKHINLEHVWAVCGAYTMGARSQLEVGTYIKSGGGARLTLTADGLRALDTLGETRWTPPGSGDRLILEEDNNLVLYAGSRVVWASNTVGSGAAWLSIRDDGTFVLTDKANKVVWVSDTGTRDYRRRIVQYDGDGAAQKTAWVVGNDGNRRWIPDLPTYECLRDAGSGNAVSLSSDVLDKVPNLTDVWAVCGGDRIGADSALEAKGHLSAGDYRLTLSATELVLTRNGTRVWAAGQGGEQLKLQTDGNLVMYDKEGRSTWATNTKGTSAGWLVLGTDGSLRLYDDGGKQVWSR